MGLLIRQFDYLSVVDSTNEYLKSFVNIREPRMVVAAEQTAGKGRHGHSWHSPPEEGLYVSYLLFPDWGVERAPYLTMIAGLAVHKSILDEGGKEENLILKPPNDVLIRNRKVSGILTEISSSHNRITWVIVGIGVNLYQRNFPDVIESRATSLALEGISISDSLEFCDRVTEHLETGYLRLVRGQWQEVQSQFEVLSKSV